MIFLMTFKMIRTFVFFDLETTGLISGNTMPKITELSLIAVSRDALCDSKETLPRVLHKLILPINPGIPIPDKVESITKLSNKDLKDVSPFKDKEYSLVTNFIERLQIPLCFVAYNGNNFDYPILLQEFLNISKAFNEHVLSIDMLLLVKDFFNNRRTTVDNVNIVQNIPSTTCDLKELNILLNDGYDSALWDAMDSIMNTSTDTDKSEILIPKHPNTLTPRKLTTLSDQPNVINKTPSSNSCKTMQEVNEKTPESQIIKCEGSNVNFQHRNTAASTRRKLDFTNSRPANFKLSTVCKHILGTEPLDVHTAEGDCLTMLRCASHLGDFFVKWADRRAELLSIHKRA